MAGDNAPVWDPDSSTSTCLVCKETMFSLINRRVIKNFFQMIGAYLAIQNSMQKEGASRIFLGSLFIVTHYQLFYFAAPLSKMWKSCLWRLLSP